MDTTLFWNTVKTLIKAHKLSQVQFADYIGLNPATFSGWIYHKRIPDFFTALDIAAALGVSIEYLAFGKDGEIMEVRTQQAEERKTAAGKIKELTRELQDEIQKI